MPVRRRVVGRARHGGRNERKQQPQSQQQRPQRPKQEQSQMQEEQGEGKASGDLSSNKPRAECYPAAAYARFFFFQRGGVCSKAHL